MAEKANIIIPPIIIRIIVIHVASKPFIDNRYCPQVPENPHKIPPSKVNIIPRSLGLLE